MLRRYVRKCKSFPKGEFLEAIPSLDKIITKFLATGELDVNSHDTLGYDFDSNTPDDIDSVPKDKGLIDFALEGKAVPNNPVRVDNPKSEDLPDVSE